MNLASIKELRGIPIGQVLTFENSIVNVTTVTSPVKLLGADPYRISVTITSSESTTNVYLRYGRSTRSAGLYLPLYGVPVVLTDDIHPGAAGMPLWVVSSSAGPMVTAVYTRLIA